MIARALFREKDGHKTLVIGLDKNGIEQLRGKGIVLYQDAAFEMTADVLLVFGETTQDIARLLLALPEPPPPMDLLEEELQNGPYPVLWERERGSTLFLFFGGPLVRRWVSGELDDTFTLHLHPRFSQDISCLYVETEAELMAKMGGDR